MVESVIMCKKCQPENEDGGKRVGVQDKRWVVTTSKVITAIQDGRRVFGGYRKTY